MIQYDGVWVDFKYAPPNSDEAYVHYYNQTFHATNQSVSIKFHLLRNVRVSMPPLYGKHATAEISFNGSAVYLFGAFRDNHVSSGYTVLRASI